MQMSSGKYVNIKYGTNDLTNLVKLEEFERLSKDPPADKPMYYSLFYYNEEQYQAYKKTKSVKGTVDVKTDNLIFDFDSHDNLEAARNDTIELIKRLKKTGYDESNYKIYLSGSKGYHVHLKLENELNPTQLKVVATQHFGRGLDTLDLKVYDPQRIFRVPNSLNEKSGLYKNQITETQLSLPIEQVKATCKVKVNQNNTIKPVKLNEKAMNFVNEIKKPKLNDNVEKLGQRPSHWLNYKWELLNAKGLKQGERDEALVILAATCKGLGYNRDIAESFLNYFDGRYAEVTEQDRNEEQVQEKLDSVFRDNWNGGTYTVKNSPWLQSYCKRLGIKVNGRGDKIIKIGDVSDGFAQYIKHIEENTIKTGIKKLDDALPITIGMNLGILAAASAGKTALALSILKNTSAMGNVSVMASLDMARNRLFEKLLLKESDFSRKELYQAYKDGKVDDTIEKIKRDYENVWFYDRSSPTVDDIREYVERVEEETGKKVKLIMLDYFERIGAEKSDDTAASKEVSGKIQDMLNDLDVAVITLVQPNKFALSAGPDSPILNYTAIKGSSFLYQSFRSIISLWRPFFNPATKDKDKFMQIAILKNDLGELDQFDFVWNGKRGEISEPTDEQARTLQAWLDEKNGVNKKNDGWD